MALLAAEKETRLLKPTVTGTPALLTECLLLWSPHSVLQSCHTVVLAFLQALLQNSNKYATDSEKQDLIFLFTFFKSCPGL